MGNARPNLRQPWQCTGAKDSSEAEGSSQWTLVTQACLWPGDPGTTVKGRLLDKELEDRINQNMKLGGFN